MARTILILAAVAALAAPAAAETACDTVDTDHSRASACVTVIEDDGRLACASASLDPSKNVTDEQAGGYTCLADFGAGQAVYSCFYAGRRYILCTR